MSEFEKKGYSSTKLEKIIEFSKINGTPEEIEQKFDTNLLESWNDLKIIFKALTLRVILTSPRGRVIDFFPGVLKFSLKVLFNVGTKN